MVTKRLHIEASVLGLEVGSNPLLSRLGLEKTLDELMNLSGISLKMVPVSATQAMLRSLKFP